MSDKYNHDVFISFSFKDQALADYIVNQLTSKYRIPCWICTEQIRAGDYYYDDIADAISASKVLVFVQTKNSVESKEIPDEILTAIDEGKTIVSFILEDSELRGQMKLKLKHRQHIDAREPELDDRIRDLAKELCVLLDRPFGDDSGSATQVCAKEKLLSTPSVLPKNIFCGRDEILKDIQQQFENGERVLFLYGIGGIGKTQIAKQYAKQYKKDYDTIIYATYNGSLKNLILSDMNFAIDPAMVRYTLSDGTMEKDDDFYKRKLEKIKKLTDEKTLIILDNFDVENDEYLIDLLEINCRLLITTRCDYSRCYSTIKIAPIDSMEALKDIFMKNYDGYEVEREDPDLEELIDLVNRHTYTVELLAQHMENSGQSTKEMIDALKKEGILSLNEEVRNADMKTGVAYENLLKMFKIFSLSEEEKQILMYLSLMPIEGVSVRDFKEWAGLTSLKQINRLEKRSWIVRNTEGIALHPIIKSVIQHELPATEENCLDFINKFVESIGEKKAWYLTKADKDKYGIIAKKLLSVFQVITLGTEDLYYNCENLLSFTVDPEYAEKLAEMLYVYYTNKYAHDCYEIGRSAFKFGWLYSYNTYLPNAIEKALKWLGEAHRILSNIQLETTEQIAKLAQTKVNLAKMYMLMFEQTKEQKYYLLAKDHAIRNVEHSFSVFKKGDPQYGKLAGAYIQLAEVLLVGGECETALDNIEKSLDILIPMNTEDNGDSMLAINRKAAILYAMGKYGEAKYLVQKGVKGYEKYFGESNLIIIGLYILLGDCCTALNEPDEALQAYTKALEIAEKLYAPGAKQITEIGEKIRVFE